MARALRLASRGHTSPNPMVGALVVQGGRIIGGGWHHRAGEPHAEIEALRQAQRRGLDTKGATLYITLEPCSTHGRTPPCTEAIIAAGIRHVVIGATDANPLHQGKAFRILRRAGIRVTAGILQERCEQLNLAFNHWIVHRRPLVTVKAAMTLDGKVATSSGESKWITGPRARAWGRSLRSRTDAILAGINTILADDPSLTARGTQRSQRQSQLRRIILDSRARTPLTSKVVTDEHAALTTIVVSKLAPAERVAALRKRVNVVVAPVELSPPRSPRINLRWLLKRLGTENITSLLVEG